MPWPWRPHRLQHLLFQEAGKPGAVDEQDVRDILPRGRGEDLLLHGVVIQRDRLDLHVVLRLELGKQGLVGEVGGAGGDVACGVPQGDGLGRAGQGQGGAEEQECQGNRERFCASHGRIPPLSRMIGTPSRLAFLAPICASLLSGATVHG
jgi:hypothetical protein